jgi:ribose transport system substrate-binding protein
MSRTIKTIIFVVLSCLMSGAAWAKPLNITWIAGNAALQTEHRIRDGFAAYQKQHNLTDWKITYLDSAGSAEKVANNIQDAVSRGSNFIIVTVADLRASDSALAGAEKAKIPVFTADCGWIPGSTTDVTTNNWQMSSDVTLTMVNRLHGKGNIVVLTGDGWKPVRERTDTLKAVLKEYPNIKVLSQHDLNLSNFYQDAMNSVQDAATRFGKKIDAVWAPWDEPAQAAVTALRAAGLGNVPVTGMDGHPTALKAICAKDSNFIATGRQQFETWGDMLAGYVDRVGEKGQTAASVKTADIVYTPAKLFTQADCGKAS